MRKAIVHNEYQYKTDDLCKALGVSRYTLIIWEKKGYFTPPRVGMRGDRRFTKSQLAEIVRSFAPGSKKRWHFRGNDPLYAP